MYPQPTISECLTIALQALQTHDIPAVVFYDDHSDAIIAESIVRFISREDFSSARYRILLRVEEGFIYALESIKTTDGNGHVVDISATHSEPRAVLHRVSDSL